MSVGYKARLEAMLKEFPFISRYVGGRRLRNIPRISRVNLNVIDYWGFTDNWFRGRGLMSLDMPTLKSFYLLDKDGVELGVAKPWDVRVESQGKMWGIFNRGHKQIMVPGETVYDAIMKFGDPDQIRFVVEVIVVHSDVAVTIYKVPAGIPFSHWLAGIKEIAEKELELKISNIDAE